MPKANSSMSVHITPQQRAGQFRGELEVKDGKLWCGWCDKYMNHTRKDAIMDHLHSKGHQENRVLNGAKPTFDIYSKEVLMAKSKSDKRKIYILKNSGQSDLSLSDDNETSHMPQNEESAVNLRMLFQESDSDSETSFEGFDSPPDQGSRKNKKGLPRPSFETTDEDDSRRSARPHKRPARLSDFDDHTPNIGKVADQAAFVSTMAKKRRTTETDEYYSSPSSPDLSPPARIRSMPIKKQISYSARHSDSTSPTSPSPRGSLKMKFSRTSTKKTKQEYSVNPDKNVKVLTKSGPGKGLKLKFVWKKKQHSKSNSDSSNSYHTSDADSTVAQHDTTEETSRYEEMLRGIKGENEESKEMSKSFEEVVEEEIVEMKEEEVVGEVQDWVQPENPLPAEEEKKEVDIKPTPPPRPARIKKQKPVQVEAEPPVKKTKPIKGKKIPVHYDKKRKMTGYMLWAKQMREKVSRQYPGLEFGDVSKKLGDMWKRMPDKEKELWKLRNMKLGKKGQIEQTRATYVRKSGSRMIETGPKKKPPPVKHHVAPASPPVKNPEAAMRQELSRLPPPSIESLDSAAYLALLSESFSKLSAKARKIESHTVIQGAESVLLDSLVCALGPLISLTRHIPELNDAIDQKTMSNCFSNIAHIMPGL